MWMMLILLFNTIFATAQEEPTASSVASSDCIVSIAHNLPAKENVRLFKISFTQYNWGCGVKSVFNGNVVGKK